MPDWKPPLAARLAPLSLRPEREREIIDELSQHLDDRYQELRAGGVAEDEAMRLALDEIDDDGLLAREMRTLKQASAPQPIAERHAAAPAASATSGRTWLRRADAAQECRASPPP